MFDFLIYYVYYIYSDQSYNISCVQQVFVWKPEVCYKYKCAVSVTLPLFAFLKLYNKH